MIARRQYTLKHRLTFTVLADRIVSLDPYRYGRTQEGKHQCSQNKKN